MYAWQLLARLRLLTLAGCEQGELLWIGTTDAWNKIAIEEESILRDWDIKKEFDRYYQLIRQK